MAQATISARVDSSDKTAFDPFYSESNMTFLKEGIQALNSGKGVIHDLIEEDDQ